MNKDKIWLSSPHMGNREWNFVKEAFETNWIAPSGPNVNGFEEDLQLYSKVKHAAALSSGTAAIHLSLILSNVQNLDVVLCQTFTFSATVNPILYQGAIPVFIDSELGNWNMSSSHLETALKKIHNREVNYTGLKLNPESVKCMLPVHLYGMPASMDNIMEIADRYDIMVIEDAAESLGSVYRRKHTGTFGKMGIYSFNGNKIITTSGGGALVSDDENLIDKARFLATQARDKASHYEHSQIGYNYRMSNILAGIGRGQMLVLSERIEQRRANFQRYKDYFENWNSKGFNIQFQKESSNSFSNRWLNCILIDPSENNGLNKETIRLTLKSENIESRPLWKPMHIQPVFEDYPFFGDGTSEYLFQNGLCLPSGSNLTNEDFERIFSVLDKIFNDHLR